jgi:hypothetical protein
MKLLPFQGELGSFNSSEVQRMGEGQKGEERKEQRRGENGALEFSAPDLSGPRGSGRQSQVVGEANIFIKCGGFYGHDLRTHWRSRNSMA